MVSVFLMGVVIGASVFIAIIGSSYVKNYYEGRSKKTLGCFDFRRLARGGTMRFSRVKRLGGNGEVHRYAGDGQDEFDEKPLFGKIRPLTCKQGDHFSDGYNVYLGLRHLVKVGESKVLQDQQVRINWLEAYLSQTQVMLHRLLTQAAIRDEETFDKVRKLVQSANTYSGTKPKSSR